MTKSIVFSVVASLEALAIVIGLSFKCDGLFFPLLGFSFLIWAFSRIMRFNSSLNVYFLFSLFVPIAWLVFDVLPRMIQSDGGVWDNATFLLFSPCIGIATWIEVVLNRFIHGTPLVIQWPSMSEKE